MLLECIKTNATYQLPNIPMMLIDIKGHLIENDKWKASNELMDLLAKESYKVI